MSPREARTLRPGRVRVGVGLVASTLVLALSIASAVSGALVGMLVLALFAFVFLVYAFQLVHPRSRATRLDAEGFRVWNVWGQPIHSVAWDRVAEFGPVQSYGPWGRPAELVGFRCDPRLTPRGPRLLRQHLGDFDACLPDYYAGFDSTLELMLEYANEGRLTPARLSGHLSPL